MQTKSISKREYWRQHIIASERFPGSLREFCKHKGISLSNFHYWRNKFSNESQGQLIQNPNPFVPVAVEQTQVMSSMPDASWLAELILHLQMGSK